jgi:preprotein translocase subunit YajC
MKNTVIQLKCIINSLIIALFVMFALTDTVNAQQNITGELSKTYQVTLNDGSVISGKLISITDNEVVIQSGTMGDIRLEKMNIKSMTQVSSVDQKKSGIWFQNPNPSKYLLGNSAIPMEKKSGYYQNTWIFFNSFGYAITNNISISAGFEIFSILMKGDGPFAFYVNPKASFKIAENFYAGANILYANTIRTVDEFGGLATLNGFFTYGNSNNNLTAAVGWGWADGEFSSKPVITISGMARASKRIAFVSENWIIPGIGDESKFYGIFSYGIRFLGEKNSIDLAFLNNKDIAKGIIIGIPWLDFTINF